MKANKKYSLFSLEDWANIKLISQNSGYTDRKTKGIKVPSPEDVKKALLKNGLDFHHLVSNKGYTADGKRLISYFEYRAHVLDTWVKENLLDKEKAKALFENLKFNYQPKCPLPINKQKGSKKTYAYLTGMINMILEKELGSEFPCNFDPKGLTTVTSENKPFRTLSRRIDGAYPDIVNPIAIWEIKEYYYTTTFGSRVADGVYETLLDGFELNEILATKGQKIFHYLFIDDYYTWWTLGRSYLCRLIDSLQMGFIDELIVGKEVVTQLPKIVQEWKTYKSIQKLRSH